MTEKNGNVVSFDLIYQFSKEEIENRIEEVRITEFSFSVNVHNVRV